MNTYDIIQSEHFGYTVLVDTKKCYIFSSPKDSINYPSTHSMVMWCLKNVGTFQETWRRIPSSGGTFTDKFEFLNPEDAALFKFTFLDFTHG